MVRPVLVLVAPWRAVLFIALSAIYVYDTLQEASSITYKKEPGY